MGSPSRRSALDQVIDVHGDELREEVVESLPKIIRSVLKRVELMPGDCELLADAVLTDLDGSEAWLSVASYSLDELVERFSELGLAW